MYKLLIFNVSPPLTRVPGSEVSNGRSDETHVFCPRRPPGRLLRPPLRNLGFANPHARRTIRTIVFECILVTILLRLGREFGEIVITPPRSQIF